MYYKGKQPACRAGTNASQLNDTAVGNDQYWLILQVSVKLADTDNQSFMSVIYT